MLIKKERSLLIGLIHRSKGLAWLEESLQGNVFDAYFESIGYEPSNAAFEAENRKFNDRMVYNRLVGYEDELTNDESLEEEDSDVIDEDANAERML